MLIDLGEPDDLQDLRADVCIIGGGAAGLTLARALAGPRCSVIVLESGGVDFEAGLQQVTRGANLGHPYYDLHDTRLRFLGGTTNIWGGRCVPLDPIDFVARPWVPHSGWPIGPADLQDGIAAAQRLFEVGEPEYGPALWPALGVVPPPFDPARLTTGFWRFDDAAERFSVRHATDLRHAPHLRVITHANVTRLQVTADATAVTAAQVADLAGHRAAVGARVFVLAAGGIDNPRLLLASNDVAPGGLGNGHDQVGRYFMEHPHGRLGRIVTAEPFPLWDAFRRRPLPDGVPVAPVLRPGEALQRAEGILNTILTFKWQRVPAGGVPLGRQLYQSLKHQLNPDRTNRALWQLSRSLRRLSQRVTRQAWWRRRSMRRQGFQLSVMIRGEQAPDPASRVVLSTRRDAFGVPLADLDWRMGALEKHTLQVLGRVLDDELRRLGLGRFEPEPWIADGRPEWPIDPTVGNHPIAGYHHIGTTRMSRDPRHGVVDPDCRVHGIDNLYIAGSSVFPTAGWANPTLTLLALTFRLKAHLEARLIGATGSGRQQNAA